MSKQRYPLSLHITSLFMVLTALVGAVLIAISYQHAQQLLTGSAKELSNENSRKLESVFQVKTGPILTTLDFMAVSDAIKTHRFNDATRKLLNPLQIIFEHNPGVVALYYANTQGDLTVIRPLRNNTDRVQFNAPDKATIMINQTSLSGLNRFRYLDGNFEQVGKKELNDNTFDPRGRPWFVNTTKDGTIRLTEPYYFYFLKTYGVTLSRRSPNGDYVVGADFTLSSLSEQVSKLGYSNNTKLMLFDHQFKLLAHHNVPVQKAEEEQPVTPINGPYIFSPFIGKSATQTLYETIESDGQSWSITLTPVNLNKQTRLLLAEATPQDDLLASLLSMRDKQVKVAMSMLAMSFVIVWFVAQRLARPLNALMAQTENISRFNFKKTRYNKSVIREVANLTKSIELMEHTLYDLLRLLRDTAQNQDFCVLAKTLAHQTYLVTKAETIHFYTWDEQSEKFVCAANHAIIPFKIDINEIIAHTAWVHTQLEKGDLVHLNFNDNALANYRDKLYNSDLYLFPLHNREHQLVGLQLIGYERAITEQQQDKHAFLQELLSFGAIAKENIDRIEQQKEMLNAFVELIASAIDTKSPYTGSHCQRVPELTKMMAKVAHDDDCFFPEFSLNKEQWEALHLASWLHDCGKVTTPEYVIDKATKLETIYDRIHEVRMRFELLKSDAVMNYWKAIAEGEDDAQLKDALDNKLAQLDADFEFIAQCNIGGESMSEQDKERLVAISQYQWTRTLDDQLGVSWIEQERAGKKSPLPTAEYLLSDKAVHQIKWPDNDRPQDIWQDTYTLKPSKFKYNRGELYNLMISRGTLNNEERFIINDHIIQTQMMLNTLPYPKHLQSIPEIAGGHHERLDGQGYPRGLYEEQLSVPARIMAIADIFEALTSSDRPYKKAKSLKESISIMTEMATSGHIDPKLYLLFLQSELDQEYAKMFLASAQIIDFDREAHIRKVKTFLKSKF
ncbi:metal-dependent phosphohydrolase [Vibrio aquaticus]|uniref:Metal-dependent phosphohydrolase n=1 Tax=Vibrio aquaticus TaxID=2496559 RepID=A0A432CZY3_9VIBR|nr:HD domain-containing phosphohydrolase [Vibrio aquaticus]RTZ17217.1 metal-dependent phosphohydrolase [Vibrio aquaticus]